MLVGYLVDLLVVSFRALLLKSLPYRPIFNFGILQTAILCGLNIVIYIETRYQFDALIFSRQHPDH